MINEFDAVNGILGVRRLKQIEVPMAPTSKNYKNIPWMY
jgi:hypothetical protein